MRNFRLLVVLVFAVLGGCNSLFPKTAALEKIHDAYRYEFARTALSDAFEKICSNTKLEDSFPVTRAEINAFRSKYGSDSPEAAHLTVLEGMIYLQMTQFGLARAYQGEVQAAGGKLTSGTGDKVRDALFAENYASLVEGWEATCDGEAAYNNVPLMNAAKALDTAATSLQSRLSGYTSKNKLASSEIDQGALYLMASAVQFRRSQLSFTEDAKCGESNCNETSVQEAKRDLRGAVCQMMPMLTEAEQSGLAIEKLKETSVVGRLRYVVIYRDARNASGLKSCDRVL